MWEAAFGQGATYSHNIYTPIVGYFVGIVATSFFLASVCLVVFNKNKTKGH